MIICVYLQVRLVFEEPESGVTVVKLTHTDVPEEDRWVFDWEFGNGLGKFCFCFILFGLLYSYLFYPKEISIIILSSNGITSFMHFKTKFYVECCYSFNMKTIQVWGLMYEPWETRHNYTWIESLSVVFKPNNTSFPEKKNDSLI